MDMKQRVFTAIGAILGGALLLALGAFATYVFLFYPREAEPFEISPAEPSTSILIATQGTDFKDALVKALCDSLSRSSAYIKGVDVGQLTDVDAGDWDHILILSSHIVRLNGTVASFLSHAVAPERVLLLVTSGGADWRPEPGLDVDALSSASRPEYVGDLVGLVADRIGKEDGQEWDPDDYVLALRFYPRVDVEAACRRIALERERYKDTYPNLRSAINQLGYRYLRREDVRAALEVFRLNVALFPGSWNVYDSYGEALLMGGDQQAAAANYRKALELNPDSRSARDMLKKLSTD